jgi:hypothetical protein
LRWTVRLVERRGHQSWTVTLSSAQVAQSFVFDSDERRPTESVGQDAAKALALDFLRQHSWPTSELNRMSHRAHYDENGSRHDFTWGLPTAGVAEAERRVRVWTLGSRVAGFSHHLDLPDDWEREASRLDHWRDLVQESAFSIGAVVLLLALLVPLARRKVRGLRWDRRAPWLGAATALLLLAGRLSNAGAAGVEGLDHDASIGVFFGQQALRALPFALGMGVLVAMAWVVLVGLAPRLNGSRWGAELLAETWSRPPWRWRGAPAAIAWALATLALGGVVSSVAAWVQGSPRFDPLGDPYDALASASPVLTSLLTVALEVPFWVIVAALIVYLRHALGPRGPGALLVALGSLYAVSAVVSGEHRQLDAMSGMATFVMLVVVVGLWPAYAFWLTLLGAAASWLPGLWHGPDEARWVAVVAGSALLGALALAARSRRLDGGTDPGGGGP